MPLPYFKQYLTFSPTGLHVENIIRACLLSDYNTPLYYLLLAAWLSQVGISDLNLRIPAIIFSLFTLPFIWLIASRLGNRKSAFISCLFFAAAPVSLYFSTEGRLYALLVFLSSVFIWLTILLPAAKRGSRLILAAAWVIVSGLALLISYVFSPAFVACTIWLACQHKSFPLKYLIPMFLSSAMISMVWYLRIPQVLAIHNVGSYCQSGHDPLWLMIMFPFSHLLSFTSSIGSDPGIPQECFSIFTAMILLPFIPLILPIFKNRFWNNVSAKLLLIGFLLDGAMELIIHVIVFVEKSKQLTASALILFLFLAILIAVWKYFRNDTFIQSQNFDPRLQLLYLIIAMSTVSPCLFDLVRNMHMSYHYRYTLSCLPAAIVLAAIALSKCQKQLLILLLIISVSIPIYLVYGYRESRNQGEDYKRLGRILAHAKANDLIIVDYCYVITAFGVARYLPVEKELVAWSSYVHRDNLEDDLTSILRGKKGVYLVRIGPDDRKEHANEGWLAHNAIKKQDWFFSMQDYCKYFIPKKKETF